MAHQHNPYPRKPWLAALLGFGLGPWGLLYSSNLLAILSIILILAFLGFYVTSMAVRVVLSLIFGTTAYFWSTGQPNLSRFPALARFDRPSWIKGLILSGVIVLAWFLYTGFVSTPVSTSGYPMAPTILSHERVMASISPSFRKNVQRGTVVLYFNKEVGKRAISRVVGIPGDLIEVRHGLLYLNNKAADDPARIDVMRKVGCIDQKLELNNSASIDKSGAVRVPPNHVYLLADNRSANFEDSRYFGPISDSLIVGIVHPNKRDLSQIKPEDCQQPAQTTDPFPYLRP